MLHVQVMLYMIKHLKDIHFEVYKCAVCPLGLLYG